MSKRLKVIERGVRAGLMLVAGIVWAEGNEFREVVMPFLETHCYECHGVKSKKADLDLTVYKDDSTILQDVQHWRGVLKQVNSGEMPPKKFRAQPTAEGITELNQALQVSLARAESKMPLNPGRVTARRLNRTEYNNTVRDLLSVDYDAAENFPADDIGHGFDNIGDVLTLSPLHLERYLDAAEGLAERAIHTKMPRPPTRTTASIFLEPRGYRSENSRRPVLNDRNEVFVSHSVQVAGKYIFRVRAGGTNALDATPPLLAMYLGDKELLHVDVTNPPSSWKNFDIELELEEGEHRFSARFLNPPTILSPKLDESDEKKAEKKEGEPANAESAEPAEGVEGPERMLFVNEFKVIGPADQRTDFMKRVDLARGVKTLDDSRKAGRKPEGTSEGDEAQVNADGDGDGDGESESTNDGIRDVVRWFLSQAFRRPATDEEIERYEAVLRAGQEASEGDFYGGLRDLVSVVLCSPKFLFRLELDDRPTGDGPQVLDDYQLASRLSYFLWSTMPDQTLLDLAERGELTANLQDQVRRMLADSRSSALVENFGMQWLQLQRLKTFQPDPEMFPQFNEGLRLAMLKETELFMAEIVQQDRSVLDLIASDFSYVNRTLARHYGLDDAKLGEGGRRGGRGGRSDLGEFVRVTFEPGTRGGLLTQASILTATSNPTRTSPVKRGKWVLEQLLGTPPPPPPPDVQELEEGAELVGTLRQRMEQHRANIACANCHQSMDAMGFAFENFDAIGRFRTREGEDEIDASGELPDGQSFDGAAELKQVLVGKSELLARNLAEKLMIYGLGRGLEYYDDRAVRSVVEELKDSEYRFSALVTGIVKSDPFRLRRGRDGEAAAVEAGTAAGGGGAP